ncbi:MAG TPA: hypothetical protein VJH67_02590 [Candidatus Paceibacterota bacterium]
MDISLLLPREQYREVHKKHGRAPFMFEIENYKQLLFYFGANHSRDPNDSQYSVLRKYWNKFLKSTEDRDRIVLVEGGLRRPANNEEKAIKEDSEAGLVTFFAHQANIPVDCPDIIDNDLVKLLPNNSKEVVLLYYFLSFANQWRGQSDPKPDFEKYTSSWLETQNKRKIWEGMDTSFERMKQLYKENIGKEFDQNDNFNDLVNPNRTETAVNKIARAQSDLRDANVASEIERYWNEGKSIFVAFGSGHLIIQEPALKKVLK